MRNLNTRCQVRPRPALLLLLLLLLALSGPTARAQTRLSLPAALELGLKNRADGQANQLDVALAENSIRKTRNAWLPELTLSGNVRYNTALPTTVVPAGALPGVSADRRLTFGTRNSSVFGLELVQPLYRPAAGADRALAENNRALAQEKNRQSQTDAKVRIAEAYLNVLLREVQRDFAQADARRAQTYFDLAAGRHRLGALLEDDYQTAQLDRQNGQRAAAQATRRHRAAQARLCYELALPFDSTLVLTDRIDPTQTPAPAPVPTGPANDGAPARPELRRLQIELEGYALQSRKVRAGLRPTVSLYGNYSTQFQYDDFDYFSRPWNTFNYVGLQVAVPLSGQLTRHTNLQAYELSARQTALRLRQTEADLANDVFQARTELANAASGLQSTQASLALAQQLHQRQQARYRLGTLLARQLLDAEKSLQIAEQNHLEAAYTYLVARLSYEKALGQY